MQPGGRAAVRGWGAGGSRRLSDGANFNLGTGKLWGQLAGQRLGSVEVHGGALWEGTREEALWEGSREEACVLCFGKKKKLHAVT